MLDLTDLIPEWNNDEKMRAMFAVFPEKEENETVYSSRLAFWDKTIQRIFEHDPAAFARNGHVLICDYESIKGILTRNGNTPASLPLILVRDLQISLCGLIRD